jgi:hypothetical protein
MRCKKVSRGVVAACIATIAALLGGCMQNDTTLGERATATSTVAPDTGAGGLPEVVIRASRSDARPLVLSERDPGAARN